MVKTLEFNWITVIDNRLIGLTTSNQKFISSEIKGLITKSKDEVEVATQNSTYRITGLSSDGIKTLSSEIRESFLQNQ